MYEIWPNVPIFQNIYSIFFVYLFFPSQYITTFVCVFSYLQSILCWCYLKWHKQITQSIFRESLVPLNIIIFTSLTVCVCFFALAVGFFFVSFSFLFFSLFCMAPGIFIFLYLYNKKFMEINFFIFLLFYFFTYFAEMKYVYIINKLKASLRICWYGHIIHE